MAKGQYCVFIDPDDFYPHNKILENLYSGIAKHKAKICGGNFAEYRQQKYLTEFAPDSTFLAIICRAKDLSPITNGSLITDIIDLCTMLSFLD